MVMGKRTMETRVALTGDEAKKIHAMDYLQTYYAVCTDDLHSMCLFVSSYLNKNLSLVWR
jgi:hypothetical protein